MRKGGHTDGAARGLRFRFLEVEPASAFHERGNHRDPAAKCIESANSKRPQFAEPEPGVCSCEDQCRIPSVLSTLLIGVAASVRAEEPPEQLHATSRAVSSILDMHRRKPGDQIPTGKGEPRTTLSSTLLTHEGHRTPSTDRGFHGRSGRAVLRSGLCVCLLAVGFAADTRADLGGGGEGGVAVWLAVVAVAAADLGGECDIGQRAAGAHPVSHRHGAQHPDGRVDFDRLRRGGPVFAIALTGIMVIGFRMQTMGTTTEIDYRSAALTWIAPNVIAILVLVVGSFFDGTVRLGFWLGTVAIVLWAMVKAADGEWLVRSGHFAERHGLIIIIALGEVIVAIGIPVVAALESNGGLSLATISALLASGGFAGLLWWAYFDRPSPGLEYAASKLDGRAAGRYIRDVYTWAHAPIVAGIILAAAALEEIALHPRDTVPLEFRAMMAAGLFMFLIGVYLAVWRAFRAQARERLVGAMVIAGIIFLGASLEGLNLLTLVVVVMFAVLVIEHRRIQRLRLHAELES